jgi:hypothetical protein
LKCAIDGRTCFFFALSFLFSQVFLAGYWKIEINLCKPISYILLCIFIHFWSCYIKGGITFWKILLSGVFWTWLIRWCTGMISWRIAEATPSEAKSLN